MDYKEIKMKTTTELALLMRELQEKHEEYLFKVGERQLKNVRDMRKVKKQIAQVQTELALREDVATL